MIRGATRVLGLVLLVAACGSPLPLPPLGPHLSESFIIVPYPPPPAHVEIIPEPPTTAVDMVWVDGEWRWKGRRWVWNGGQWQLPQPGAYFAFGTTVRLSDGTLAWFAGQWELAGARP